MKWLAKPVIWAAVIVVAAGIGLVKYYQAVQRDYWSDRHEVLERALAETPLENAEAVEPIHGEREAFVLFGTDGDGRELIVIVSDEVRFVYADEGVSRNAVEVFWRQKHEDGKVIHTLPVLRGGDIVWEVFSLRPTDKGDRYFYDYYRFADGEWLETLTLSLK